MIDFNYRHIWFLVVSLRPSGATRRKGWKRAELFGPPNLTGLDYELCLISKLLGYQYAYLPQTIHGEAVHSAGTLPFQQDGNSLALQMRLDNIGSELTLSRADDHEV